MPAGERPPRWRTPPGLRARKEFARKATNSQTWNDVEFLEYLTPTDGRPRPADVRGNDVVHWQTIIVTDDVDLLAKKLRDAHVSFVSPGVVAMPKEKAGFSKGALVCDPDGHDVLLIQK